MVLLFTTQWKIRIHSPLSLWHGHMGSPLSLAYVDSLVKRGLICLKLYTNETFRFSYYNGSTIVAVIAEDLMIGWNVRQKYQFWANLEMKSVSVSQNMYVCLSVCLSLSHTHTHTHTAHHHPSFVNIPLMHKTLMLVFFIHQNDWHN